MVSRARLFVIVCCCCFVLASCGAKKSAPLDYSKPKTKASQKPYVVDGKRYEPLASERGFVQTGVASWYGRDFHGKKTSSGEIYDMHAMTAAHKTLPLGVYVTVRNMDNGRETIVRVNDRGPFVKGRVLDLSYAAARKLGYDMIGTAPVRITALGYRKSGASSEYQPAANYDAGDFSVQVGSFKEFANADRLSRDMKQRFGFSEVHKSDVNGETFYRVYAGRYTSLAEAEKAEDRFIDLGFAGSFSVARE
jgi:rare lipoprotein A